MNINHLELFVFSRQIFFCFLTANLINKKKYWVILMYKSEKSERHLYFLVYNRFLYCFINLGHININLHLICFFFNLLNIIINIFALPCYSSASWLYFWFILLLGEITISSSRIIWLYFTTFSSVPFNVSSK